MSRSSELVIKEFAFRFRVMEHSGSVVECLRRDPGATGLSLTDVTALWLQTLSKTHLS